MEIECPGHLDSPTAAPPTADAAYARGPPARAAPADAGPIGRWPLRSAAPRGDHHGRQPPLGARSAAGRGGGARRRRRGHPRVREHAAAAASRPLDVRVLPRELVAPQGGGSLFGLLDSALRTRPPSSNAGRPGQPPGPHRRAPDDTRRSIEEALEATAGGTASLNVAFNYAGRTEIVDAVRRIVASGCPAERSTRRRSREGLYTAGLPDPDLVIRTGGEQRLSNFLIWQAAYAELYTTEVLWPDFEADAFDAALLEFASRTRRFGR